MNNKNLNIFINKISFAIQAKDFPIPTKTFVFMTMITTYGVEKNKYANLLMQNEIMMDDLFGDN